MTINRREILKAGLIGLPLCGLQKQLHAMERGLLASPIIGNKRMLTIFLRGGADGLNMVVPHEDPGYDQLRPIIKLAAADRLAMPGYPALRVNRALGQLLTIDFRKVAYLHRVGNLTAERSHFTEQHLMETGRSMYSATDGGWVPKALSQAAPNSALKAISISKRLQRMYLSSTAGVLGGVHLQQPYSPPSLLGQRTLTIPFGVPGQSTGGVAALVSDSILNGNPAYPITPDGQYLRSTVASANTSLATMRAQLSQFMHSSQYPVVGDSPPAAPAGADLSPGEIAQYSGFFARLEEAVQLLRAPGGVPPLANVVGVELGGWDTHSAQLAQQTPLLKVLGQALKAAFTDLNSDGQPFLILVVSEFGRTIADNTSGTDHGVANLTIVAGSSVKGGNYNAWSPTWTPPSNPTVAYGSQWRDLLVDVLGTFVDAQDPIRDFRVPLIEIVDKYFGVPVATLPNIGGEWDTIFQNVGNIETNRMLGFL